VVSHALPPSHSEEPAMVYLDRIYTRSGDHGETGLGDGRRVPKTHPRIVAHAAVDELNCALGVAIAMGNLSVPFQKRLIQIQNDLFDLGADLCVPESDDVSEYPPLRVVESQVKQLELWIDEETDRLKPLTSFILPGGTPGAALLHQARAVCRRAEIVVCRLIESERLNNQVLIYLNRLSDLLFVMARSANDLGASDVLWTPGASRDTK
jgi:cob(I)alamin adenosyltransferase